MSSNPTSTEKIPTRGGGAGIVRMGNSPKEPSSTPLSELTIRRTVIYTEVSYYETAADALALRVARLKESKQKYTVDGLSVSYVDRDGTEVQLTYRDLSGVPGVL